MDYAILFAGLLVGLYGGVCLSAVVYMWIIAPIVHRIFSRERKEYATTIESLRDQLESQANYKQLYESLQGSLDGLRAKYPLPKFDNHTIDEEVGV